SAKAAAASRLALMPAEGRACNHATAGKSNVADEKSGHRSIDSLDGAAEGTGEHAQPGRRYDGPIELANVLPSLSLPTGGARPKARDTRKDAPRECERPRLSATPIHQSSHDEQPGGFVSSICLGKRSPSELDSPPS